MSEHHSKSPKAATITIDRRLLNIFAIAAIYGAICFVRQFRGLEVTVLPDTFLSGADWPDAGGRLTIRSYEWWGLKRAEFLVGTSVIVDSHVSTKTKEKRWMILRGTGPQLDQSGRERFPRALFADDEEWGTAMIIWDRDMRWFDFGRVEIRGL